MDVIKLKESSVKFLAVSCLTFTQHTKSNERNRNLEQKKSLQATFYFFTGDNIQLYGVNVGPHVDTTSFERFHKP